MDENRQKKRNFKIDRTKNGGNLKEQYNRNSKMISQKIAFKSILVSVLFY